MKNWLESKHRFWTDPRMPWWVVGGQDVVNSRRPNEPCKREKYSSVAFFMISGEHVASVNMSRSRALVVLRSLHGKRNGPDQQVSLTIRTTENPTSSAHNTEKNSLADFIGSRTGCHSIQVKGDGRCGLQGIPVKPVCHAGAPYTPVLIKTTQLEEVSMITAHLLM